MIYSVLQHKEVPVTVSKKVYYINEEFGDLIRYTVHNTSEPRIHIGYVDLQDTKSGVKVSYIKNQHPDLYKHFGQIVDQIELEHCLKRGIDKPFIQSSAAINTYIQHFKRGKRFINEGINIYLDYICQNLKKGERINIGALGYQKMYMPINMINEIKEKIKILPLLKDIK